MQVWNPRAALCAAALVLGACDALSPNVVVGERVSPPPPEAESPNRVHVWEPADPLPPPVETTSPVRFDRPQVNLQLDDVTNLPSTWVPGHAQTIALEVSNGGDDRAPSTSIRLRLVTRADWVDDIEVDTLILDALAPHETRLVEAEVILPDWAPSASFAFEAHVDPDDVVVETAETDNVWFGGVIDVSEVVVRPTHIDFGATQLGCAERAELVVQNESRERIILAGVDLDAGPNAEPFRLIGPRLPRTLSPAGEEGSRVELEVEFDPTGIVEAQTRIRVSTSEHRSQPLFVPLAGSGEIAPTTTDRHRQYYGPRVDFLIVVDRGSGMQGEIDELREHVPAWVSTMDGQSMQYQIGVTLSDVEAMGGALLGPVVDSEQIDRAQNLRRVLDSVRIDPEASSEALEAARSSLANHAHWLRPDAGLVVVFLSNRDDESDGPIVDYARAISTTKPSSDRVAANAIILDGSSRCADYPPAMRFIEFVQALNGRLDPVCDRDAFESLWSLPHRGFGLRRRFDLSRAPQGQTLSARIDGRIEPPVDAYGRDVWTFDRWGRRVTFEPQRVPSPGAVVHFEYVPHCAR